MIHLHVLAHQLLDIRHLVDDMQRPAGVDQLDLVGGKTASRLQRFDFDHKDVTKWGVARAADHEVELGARLGTPPELLECSDDLFFV